MFIILLGNSFTPTVQPTVKPTFTPTLMPSSSPTSTPTSRPTSIPSSTPTSRPTSIPNSTPTYIPTSSRPTSVPSNTPSSFPTSVPSNAPTSFPTSAPTKMDLILANAFDSEVTATFVETKSRYYLGTYVGYFFGFFILLLIIEKSNLAYHTTVEKLFYSAHQAGEYEESIKNGVKSGMKKEVGRRGELSTIIQLNDVLDDFMRHSIELDQYKSRNLKQISKQLSNKSVDNTSVVDSAFKYSPLFLYYLFQKRKLLWCKPLLYPSGYSYTKGNNFINIQLPEGRYEDIVAYICANHKLFSCIYSPAGSTISCNGRRLIYIVQNSIAFSMSQIVDSFLNTTNMDSIVMMYGLSIFISIFFIIPFIMSVDTFVESMWTCPCLQNAHIQREYPVLNNVLQLLGKLILVPFLLLIFATLVVAATFSEGKNFAMVLIIFFFKVQVVNVLLDIMFILLEYKDNYHCGIYFVLPCISKITILSIGSLFCERIVSENMKEGKDYEMKWRSCLCGLIQMNVINKIECYEDGEDNYEMTNPVHNSHDINDENAITDRFSYGVFSSNSESVDYLFTENGKSRTTLNPMLHLSSICDEEIETNAENTLMESGYMDEDMEVGGLDEELAVKKKQFKAGTRSSFIAKFNKFQDLEILMGVNTSSLRNTVAIHSNSVKNNPLSNRASNRLTTTQNTTYNAKF